MQSLAAIADLRPEQAGTHAYEQYLQTCQQLGLGPDGAADAFRQVVFNIAAANRDTLLQLTERAKIPAARATDIVYQVTGAVARWPDHADTAGVHDLHRTQFGQLGLPRRSSDDFFPTQSHRGGAAMWTRCCSRAPSVLAEDRVAVTNYGRFGTSRRFSGSAHSGESERGPARGPHPKGGSQPVADRLA